MEKHIMNSHPTPPRTTEQPGAVKTRKGKRQTKAQKYAALFLELYGIVHYLTTEQRCPVMLDGKLAFVRCPGVSKEAFRQAIDRKVVNNLAHILRANGESTSP